MGLSQPLFVLCALFCACGAVQQPGAVRASRSLTVTPSNTAVFVGGTVVLECEVLLSPPMSRVLWIEYFSFASGSTISDNDNLLSHPNKDRYALIRTTPTVFHLQISEVTLEDAGTYACVDTVSAAPDVRRGEAQLIVLESPANCTGTTPTNGVVIEHQNHTIECIVFYRGAFAPTMYWFGPGSYQTAGSTTPTAVWSGVHYTVQRTMDEGVFQIITNFTSIGSVPDEGATNVPSFSHLGTFQPLTVFWGPHNSVVSPIKAEYAVGDVLKCHTDARPDAYFMWQNLRNLDVFPDSETFTVNASMLGTNQTMRCQIQNIIHGFVYSDNVFFTLYVPGPTTTTSTTTVTTTLPPEESECEEFTGWWQAENPYAELIIEMVRDSDIGEVRGIVKNSTDTVWVEVIGTARVQDWAYLGLSAIWPFMDGVTGMSGECHRCHGEEVIVADGILRAAGESLECGVGSQPNPHNPIRFRRVGTLAAAVQKEPLNVWKPTKISKLMGIQLK